MYQMDLVTLNYLCYIKNVACVWEAASQRIVPPIHTHTHIHDQSLTQSIAQFIDRSIDRSLNHASMLTTTHVSVNQSIAQPINRSMPTTTHVWETGNHFTQPLNQSLNQSTYQCQLRLTCQSLNQSIAQLINRPIDRSLNHASMLATTHVWETGSLSTCPWMRWMFTLVAPCRPWGVGRRVFLEGGGGGCQEMGGGWCWC